MTIKKQVGRIIPPTAKDQEEDLNGQNQNSPEYQGRIHSHSVKLFNTFRPTKLLLNILGLFPFSGKRLNNGCYTFHVNRCSYMLLVVMSIILCVIFALFTYGLLAISLTQEVGQHKIDRCGNSWGKTVISRNLPAIVFVWSQLMVATAGSVYMMRHSESFLEFYNLVNDSVMQFDAKATKGLVFTNLRGAVFFLISYAALIVAFCLNKLHSLEEVSVFCLQAVLHPLMPDLHLIGNRYKPYMVQNFEDSLPKCHKECKDCYGFGRNVENCTKNSCYNHINTPTFEFKIVKWIGFAIISYSILAAWAIMRQFEFFCQVLVNLISIWNKRFLNYASRENSVSSGSDDPYRRRITHKLVLKDHYQVVMLFTVAEENFSFILFVYYTSVFFNIICQLYYTTLLTTQVTCATAVKREMGAARRKQCYVNTTIDLDVNKMILEHGLKPDNPLVSFEDACSIKFTTIILHSLLTSLCMMIITMSSFVITTLEGDRASHQADVGFYRVRRKGYLSCRTKKERNAMHSLVFSFTGPKTFEISAAGYFPVRKKTIIVLTSVAFIYFLIILSFKPGMNSSSLRCYRIIVNAEGDEDQELVIKYPKVV